MTNPENYCFDNMCAHIEQWVKMHLIILQGDAKDKVQQAIDYDKVILRNVDRMRRKYGTKRETTGDAK